jgi:hypothetical protein
LKKWHRDEYITSPLPSLLITNAIYIQSLIYWGDFGLILIAFYYIFFQNISSLIQYF